MVKAECAPGVFRSEGQIRARLRARWPDPVWHVENVQVTGRCYIRWVGGPSGEDVAALYPRAILCRWDS